MGWNGSAWFSILVSAALKSTVVLGAAWMMALLLRGRSAAARHLVWTAAAAAVLALPLLSLSLPALRVPVSTRCCRRTRAWCFEPSASRPRTTPRHGGTVPADPAAAPDGKTAPAAAMRGSGCRADLGRGSAASLLQMLVAYAALWRTRRAARPFDGPRAGRRAGAVLGIRSRVPVLETGSGGMPMTFGFLRPAVSCRPTAPEWSDERRRMVLLHELAHVRRGDAATHLMARTALEPELVEPAGVDRPGASS